MRIIELHRVAYPPTEADAEEQGRALAELEKEYREKEKQAGDALFEAIKANDIKKVDKICLNWFGIAAVMNNRIDIHKRPTPSFAASSKGHVDCLRLLIESGADLN